MEWVLVAAVGGKKRALGKDNDLLWHLPNDFKHFKSLTTGHPVVMGRKTYESIGRLLPNRLNIIISRNKDFHVEGAKVFHDFQDAETYLLNQDTQKAFLIGGGQLYKEFINKMDMLEITEVHSEFEADTFFPEIDTQSWKEVSRKTNTMDEKHKFNYDFVRYKKQS